MATPGPSFFSNLAGNKDNNNISDEFIFGQI